AQVVVVGASDTGLSFLEVLCTCPHLRFCTLTLVSTHGFPTRSSHQDPGFLSTSHAHSSTDLALLPLRSCVTVVTDKMVKIDRKSKRVLVSSGRKVPYDFLLLCPGLQYQMPSRAGSGSSQTPPTRRWRHPGPAPSNLFTLNAPQDCDALRRWLLQNFVERQEDAVVYGNSLDVYTTVGALLGLGVRGSRIHLVLTPPGNTGASCFGDRAVDRAVASELERAEVRVHSDFVLTRINDGDHHLDPVTSATFSRDDSKDLRLLCGLFINLSNRGVDYDAFRAVSTSFLTFDSRIVIDAQFGTNDPAIFAAGPATKFCRRYHTDEWEHGSFNSKEVGRNLADRILGIIDPTWELDHRPPADQRLVPLYREAKIQGGTLPGGHHYLHFRKPSPSEPPAWTAPQVGPPSEERVMVTGGVETGNYFCLHLDIHQQVETLTCFSLKPFPVSNYLSLYGKHQQLLGRLLTRYHQNQVQDLYSFFTHSSCLPVFHDRFSDLQQELQQMNADKVQEAGSQQQLGDDDDALRRRAVKYLKYNRNLLPMFACRPQL
ncbi:cilia- and flagella-associated protein 61-like, partial [Cynoglossus semilaevis]|uniref:cilia- and flagella-associated protein 61-like n=1 Tax=Cynoglossus semilaevis TaxID=244447 RepID=UPI000D627DF7